MQPHIWPSLFVACRTIALFSNPFSTDWTYTHAKKETMARIHYNRSERGTGHQNEKRKMKSDGKDIRTSIEAESNVIFWNCFFLLLLFSPSLAGRNYRVSIYNNTNHCAVHNCLLWFGPTKKKMKKKSSNFFREIVTSLRPIANSSESTSDTRMDVSGSKPPVLASLFYSLIVVIFFRKSQFK